ncbi:unnamed protein product [Symbiodinium sp. CCMP2592]|nr:unnamed protein product [Symbiodinium sp. CCMP2592]
MLARADGTHIDESVVRAIVVKNLDCALRYCLDQDMLVRRAAHYVVRNHVWGGLGYMNELVAEVMLCQMREIWSLSAQMLPGETWAYAQLCLQHLEDLLTSLTKPQRQEWASFLVAALHTVQSASAASRAKMPDPGTSGAKAPWLADDDPNRSYADTKRQLEDVRTSPNLQDVRETMRSLLVT